MQKPRRLSLRLQRHRFCRDNAGVTAVEFAFVAPVMLVMCSAIVEFSLMMFAQHIMEGVAYTASRQGKTGFIESGQTREDTIRATIHERARLLFDTDQVHITTVSYNEFDQIGQPEPFIDANGNGVRDAGENYTDSNGNGQYDSDMGASGLGNTGQVVVYTITYPWQIFTPGLRQFVGDNGRYTLTSRTVVKNEPYME